MRSLCDGDHKNAHFAVASLRVPSAETRPVNKNPALRPPAGRHDQRRQIASLREKKSPALVSGAEDDDRSSFLRNQAIPIRAIGSSKRR